MESKSNRQEKSNTISIHRGTHAKTGLGPLLMFIVMVVIAAVSAGVLINAAGLLETSDGTTPPAQPDQPLQVVAKTGQISSEDPETVQTVVLTVERSAQLNTVALANVTIEWFGPTGRTILRYGGATDSNTLSNPATEFAVKSMQDADDSAPTLNAATDRFQLTIDATAIKGGRGLPAGTTVAVKFTTPSGATQFVTLEVPESLETQTTVSL